MSGTHSPRPVKAPSPREFLRAAESCANRIRKQLRDYESRGLVSRSGKTDDAVNLAELIEHVARLGRAETAANAIDLAERIELLIEQLRAEIDAILAS